MATAVGGARDALARALRELASVALDEDEIEYVLDGAIDVDGTCAPREEFVEFVWPVIAPWVDDDEARARTLAGDARDGVDAAGTTTVEETRRVDRAPVCLGEGWREGVEREDAARRATAAAAGVAKMFVGKDGRGDAVESRVGMRDREKARRAGERLAASAADERREMVANLTAARERAARARVEGRARALSNVELGPFAVPNPGGGADLIEDASVTLVPGRRYGLIGRNGKGKSTLLKFLAARRVEGIDESYSVHYVTQEVELTAEEEDMLPGDVVLRADLQRWLLLEEQMKLESSEDALAVARLQEVNGMLDAIGSASAPARVSVLLKNLGFSDALIARPMKALSGGWRVRTALAAALFAQPDILFLDEPTNHLSISAVMFLSRELSTNSVWSSRIIVTVSHDRHFLDEVTTDSMHISGAAKRLSSHGMPYSAWAKKRREQQLALKRRVEQRQEKIDKLKEFAGHGFRYGGSSSAINMMKKKELEAKKLELEAGDEASLMADLEEDAELALNLQAGGELRQNIVRFDGVSFAYPGGDELFADVDLSVDSKSRVVLLGENGQGKTTMVKIITGELEPTSGLVTRDRGARVCLVNQHHAEQLAYDKTPLAFMLDAFPGDGSYNHEQKLRSHLSGCGVLTELQNVPALALSGGQKSRVAMAAVSFQAPHLIILDEPTNNLDLESCEALAEAIENFKGGVVLVSHDQYFVERVAKEVVVIENGAVKRLESFASYKKSIAKKLANA
jgi:ATP-binding cassette subfamily F protein 3